MHGRFRPCTRARARTHAYVPVSSLATNLIVAAVAAAGLATYMDVPTYILHAYGRKDRSGDRLSIVLICGAYVQFNYGIVYSALLKYADFPWIV